MKKVISIYLILLLCISIYGCKSTLDDDYQSDIQQSEATIVHVDMPLENASRYVSDIFIATVESKKPIDGVVDFPDIFITTDTPGLYTVRVNKIIRSLTVTENSVIQICHTFEEFSVDEHWISDLEVGQTYIIAGLVQPYEDKPIIVTDNFMTAKIDDDGTLTPISKVATKALEDINTLDKFLEGEEIQRIAETEPSLLPSVYYGKEPTDEIKDDVTAKIKESIKTDSTSTFAVDFDNHPTK